jgi:hypothetical protein
MGNKGGGNENAQMSAALIASTNSRAAEYDSGINQLLDGKSIGTLSQAWRDVAQAGKGWAEGVTYISSSSGNYEQQAQARLKDLLKGTGASDKTVNELTDLAKAGKGITDVNEFFSASKYDVQSQASLAAVKKS